MARPHPALMPLAARGQLGRVEDAEALVASAVEHRMAGLLWSVERNENRLPGPQRLLLAQRDAMTSHRHRAIWQTIDHVVRRLSDAGVEGAVVKGVAAEARWYDRTGERPCNDVDLWLAPRHLGEIDDVVSALAPAHPLIGQLVTLVSRGELQSVDLQGPVPDIEIDLHFDPFKVGVATRDLEELWARTEPFMKDDVSVRVPDAATSLVLFLLHLNKDRFRYLLGHVDVRRVIERGDVDWDAVRSLAAASGLWVPVSKSLEAVFDALELPQPVAAARGPRAKLWERTWPEEIRLQGDEARVRFRYRQQVLGLTAKGRMLEAARDTVRKAAPAKPLLQLYQPGPEAGYPTLILRRVRGWRQRRRELARSTAPSSPDPRSDAGSTPASD